MLARFLGIFPVCGFSRGGYTSPSMSKGKTELLLLSPQSRQTRDIQHYYRTYTSTSTTTTTSTAFTITDIPDSDPATSYAATAENAVFPTTEIPLAKTPGGKRKKKKKKKPARPRRLLDDDVGTRETQHTSSSHDPAGWIPRAAMRQHN